MEWTKSDTLKFIELWQGFPCLWNTKHVNYKNRIKRRDAIAKLAQQMKTEASFVEKKMLSLKTQFNRETHKLKTKSGAGLDEVAQSNWYAFEHLIFLKDINLARPNRDSIQVTQTENEDVCEKIENQRPDRDSQQPRSSNKRKHDSQSSTLNLLKDASNAIINKQKKDEFSIFGEAIASELRDIKSKRDILVLKKEIMDLIYKFKIEMIDKENTQCYHTNMIDPISLVTQEVENEAKPTVTVEI